jgi:two-component system sensor histidine kinase KdpD
MSSWYRVVSTQIDRRIPFAPYVVSAILTGIVSVLLLLVRGEFGLLNIALVFVLLSLALGLLLGPRPAAFGAVLAFLSLDFLFVPPYYTFSIADRDHVLGLFAYLAVAVVSAALIGYLRDARDEAVRESRRTAILYELNRSLVADTALEPLLHSIVRSVVDVYRSESCRILVRDEDRDELVVRASWPDSISGEIDRQAAAMALHAMTSGQPAGVGRSRSRILTPHGSNVTVRQRTAVRAKHVMYVPVKANAEVIGVLEVTGHDRSGTFTGEDEALLTSFADQVALAMERTRLAAEATRAEALEQSSELKSSLLAAVSHDLRTPLAAIKASASALIDPSTTWDDATRTELLNGIDQETDRLTDMVSNLLDLSRIEGGALKPDKDWQDVNELVRDVLNRTARQTAAHQVRVDIGDDLPVVYLDYVEIAQVLINLIGNAAKYSPPGSEISVTAQRNGEFIRWSVEDNGPGIPPSRMPHIFETFYRAHDTGIVSGSGIGLAICRGLVEAHGGRIWAHSTVGDGGTTVLFEIPISAQPAEVLTT